MATPISPELNYEQIDRTRACANLIICDPDFKNQYIRITESSTFKTGKHGSSKTSITGKNILTGASRTLELSGDSKVAKVSMAKEALTMFDFAEGVVYATDSKDQYVEIDTHKFMSAEDRAKIVEALSGGKEVDSYRLVVKKLPGFFSVDFCKPEE